MYSEPRLRPAPLNAAAQAAVTAARAQLDAAEATTKGSNSSDYPAVLAASAKVREAYLALQRTRLIAPVDGFVAKRGVQLGQRVAAGSPLLTVVDLHKLWVDANFKESQLAQLRIGQKTELTDFWIVNRKSISMPNDTLSFLGGRVARQALKAWDWWEERSLKDI